MKARVALLIGNTRYEDNRLSRLKAPAGDVDALAAVLRRPTLGGFDVQTLVDRTTADVMRAVALFFKGRAADDLLLLYFSGHGLLDESRRLYFANSNTDTDLLTGTAVPASFVREEMDRSRAKSQVLVLDCCHGGAFSGGKGAVGESIGTDLIFGAEGSGRVVLTATNATQYAFEGEKLLGIPNRSVFTHYLIEGLQSGDADLDGDGKITVDELYTYVWGKIREATPAQSPMKWTYGGTGQIVLAQGLSARPRPDLIPPEVGEDILSPHIHRRRAALSALEELAVSSPPGAAAAAREMLRLMARKDDSFTLRREAERALSKIPGGSPPESVPQKRSYRVLVAGIGLAIFATAGAMGFFRRSNQDVHPGTLPTVPDAPITAFHRRDTAPTKTTPPPVLVQIPEHQEPKPAEVAPPAPPSKDSTARQKAAVHASPKGDVIPRRSITLVPQRNTGAADPAPSPSPPPVATTAVSAEVPDRPKPQPVKGSLDDLLESALSHKVARSIVVEGMNGVKSKIADCYMRFKVPGMAMVNVVIARSGKVTSADVTGKFAGTPTGACVEKAVKTASFPPSDGLTTSYPFQLK